VSDVSDAAVVRMIIADYSVADTVSGKVNIIGGGTTGVGHNPQTGLTAPFALFVSVAVPPGLANEEGAVEIVLEDSNGELVALPATAPGLPTQPLRVGQAVRFDEPRFPQPVNAPMRYIYPRAQWALSFATGLPLPVGQGFAWRVKIDDMSRDDWTERFVVIGPAAGPVLG